MAVLISKYSKVRSMKLLLLFYFLNAVIAVNGNGIEDTAPEEHNYPTVINERNKRDVLTVADSTTTTLQPVYRDDDNLNAAVDDKDNHNLLFNVGNPLRALNIVKRTPSGFIGMRGKKENEFIDYSNPTNNAPVDDDNSADWSIDPLQQAMYENALNEAYDNLLALEPRYKKAPSTFYGVRGKKYSHMDLNRMDSLLQRLEEERLRQSLLQNFFKELINRQAPNDVTKRAPTGFTGMRGKRPAPDVMDYLYDGEDGPFAYPMMDDKRGPVNGFVGLRGKKDVNHQAFKRSPLEPGNRRSKSQRFVDFSNKFVAVRGKKADGNSDGNTFATETHQGGYYVNNMPLLALHGMRGKRAVKMPLTTETEQATYDLAINNALNN
ncbi:tachykinins isoform X2 [Ceratitis capitata]|uniref:Tachykinins n=1 Tax=Ceratitis capitata TaxID=7213 RepID=W8AP88_CERCA|nr:tachykinins isoform X2 [Ceratitis capitata]